MAKGLFLRGSAAENRPYKIVRVTRQESSLVDPPGSGEAPSDDFELQFAEPGQKVVATRHRGGVPVVELPEGVVAAFLGAMAYNRVSKRHVPAFVEVELPATPAANGGGA